MTQAQEKSHSLWENISSRLLFSLSDKLKFALKVSLAMMLAYLIPMSQGWAQAQTAAITIMLIAAAGPVGESVSKGVKRVWGTIIGAVIGMTLIGIFPQERALYLLFLSLFVTFFLYLARAYKGDMTVFMLTSVTMMMVFKNGEVDDVFLYGIDRTYMTVLGIVIYMFIGIFLWPVKVQDDTLDIAGDLLSMQSEVYSRKDDQTRKREVLYAPLREKEKLLEQSVATSDAGERGLSIEQRNSLMLNIKEINEHLMLLSCEAKADFDARQRDYIENFDRVEDEIRKLLALLKSAIKEGREVAIPVQWQPVYDFGKIKLLTHLERAALASAASDMEKLHTALRHLAKKFNAIISPYPTHFKLSGSPNPSAFHWFDPEDMKGALISFLIFWTTTIFWIVVNPPAGFLVVTLATALSILTTFSPLKPSLLIVIFSLSFVFATVMYILVLPNLHYGWELGLFIFLYAFIGFYFISPKISIFFLLGIALLGINNPMDYNFNLFLMILFVFYLFLFVLLLFYYIPFSTKPEVLFLMMKNRFFHLSAKLLQQSGQMSLYGGTWWRKARAKQSRTQLAATVQKMQLWSGKIDTGYFDTVDEKDLAAFVKACESFAYLLQMAARRDIQMAQNPLVLSFWEENRAAALIDLLAYSAEGKSVEEERGQIREKMESQLKTFFAALKPDQYSEEEIVAFYETVFVYRNMWLAFFNCQELMKKLDFKALKRSRF